MATKKRANLSERIESDQATKPVDILFGKTQSHEDNLKNEEHKSKLLSSDSSSLTMNITPKEKEEPRSKRVNLLVQPSVYKEAQKKCKKLGISVNECINQFLTNWIEE